MIIGTLGPAWDAMRKNAAARAGVESLFEGASITPPPSAVESLHTQPSSPEPDEAAPTQEPADAAPSSTEPSERESRRQVHWTEAERRKVAEVAYANLQRWPDMRKIEAFRKAQESALPPERQRSGLLAWSTISDWAEPLLELLAVEAQIAEENERREREKREREERARRQAEEQEQARIAAEQAAAEQEAAIERAVAQRFEKMPIEGLIRAFAARIARETIDAMGDTFRAALVGDMASLGLFAASKQDTKPAEGERLVVVPKNRLPRVMVCGLMRQQEEDLTRSFLGSAEFDFVKTNDDAHAITARAPKADVIFMMNGHYAEPMKRAAKDTGQPVQYITGAVSALKRKLQEWLDGEVAIKAA
jgi:hypothetical protein